MSYEEDFDKIIRDKVGQAEYPFDESHWARTSQLIDADRATTRKGFWKKILLPAVIVIGVVTAYLVIPSDKDMKLASAQSQNTINSSESHVPASQLAVSETKSNQEPAILSSEINISPATSDGKKQVISSATKSSVMQANVIPSAPEANESNQSTGPETQVTSDKASKTENKIASMGVVSALAPGASKAGSNPENVSGDQDKNSLTPATASVPEDLNKETTSDKPVNADVAVVGAEATEMIEADILSAHWSLLPYSSEEHSLNMPFVLLKRYDEDYFSKKAKTHFLNAEFGGTYLFGWTTEQGKDGQGLNWFAGLNYGYYVGKFSLGVGLQAYNITNMREAFYEAEHKEYSFGSTTSYTTVTTNDMFYLSLPLRVAFHLNRSNHFGVGLNTGYLVAMHNRIEGYNVGENGISMRPSEKNKTMYEGVKTLNYIGSLFYNARISNRVAVHAEFVYSFSDLFENTANVRNAEKPVGLRLGVQYYLFDK